MKILVGVAVENKARFFQSTDWLSFGATTLAAFSVYFCTLASQVGLGFSGIYSAAAMHGGIAHPPGYPAWTIYGWLFVKLIPFSNIAWRLAGASAVAGAITCGLIALIVSRGGSLALQALNGQPLTPGFERNLRIVCGCVAGLSFGFDNAFWESAVQAGVWPLSMLLITLVIVLLFRWSYCVEKKRYLYLAALLYGLTLTNSQAMVAAALGLQILIMLASPKLIREMCFVNVLLYIAKRIADRLLHFGVYDYLTSDSVNVYTYLLFHAFGFGSAAAWLYLTIKTRRFLTEWKAVFGSLGCFFAGLSLYLYLPIVSMTNPPMNWGYPRTAEGFQHVITRGQYERIRPVPDLHHHWMQAFVYLRGTMRTYGWYYFVLALVPLFYLARFGSREKRWMQGSWAIFVCLSLLLFYILNSGYDRFSEEIILEFFSPSHIILAIWAGYGLMLIARKFAPKSAIIAPAG